MSSKIKKKSGKDAQELNSYDFSELKNGIQQKKQD